MRCERSGQITAHAPRRRDRPLALGDAAFPRLLVGGRLHLHRQQWPWTRLPARSRLDRYRKASVKASNSNQSRKAAMGKQ
jgi:hypothetical protein